MILDTNIRRVDIAALVSGSHTRMEAQWLSSHRVWGWPTNTFSQPPNRLQDPQRRSAEHPDSVARRLEQREYVAGQADKSLDRWGCNPVGFKLKH